MAEPDQAAASTRSDRRDCSGCPPRQSLPFENSPQCRKALAPPCLRKARGRGGMGRARPPPFAIPGPRGGRTPPDGAPGGAPQLPRGALSARQRAKRTPPLGGVGGGRGAKRPAWPRMRPARRGESRSRERASSGALQRAALAPGRRRAPRDTQEAKAPAAGRAAQTTTSTPRRSAAPPSEQNSHFVAIYISGNVREAPQLAI